MPFDGFGTFLRLRSWIVDATNSVKIRADFHDDEDNNFADGLSHCITKDGQTAVTQNIPFNSRRIISLADPIDPQDAATKDYADTKLKKDGTDPIPGLIIDALPGAGACITGKKSGKTRWHLCLGNADAESTGNVGSNYDLKRYADDGTTVLGTAMAIDRATGLAVVAANPTAALGIATKQYADNASADKLPLAGGAISGNLGINGTLTVGSYIATVANVVYFGPGGSAGYLQWQGGGNYFLGSGGTIWHSGNFNPNASSLVSSGRWINAGQYNHTGEGDYQPFWGGVVTGAAFPAQYPTNALVLHYRYLQLKTTDWFTVGYYP